MYKCFGPPLRAMCCVMYITYSHRPIIHLLNQACDTIFHLLLLVLACFVWKRGIMIPCPCSQATHFHAFKCPIAEESCAMTSIPFRVILKAHCYKYLQSL